MISWRDNFIKKVDDNFVPIKAINETEEMLAHESKEKYIKYYCDSGSCQGWGVLSILYKPKVIVEFGTGNGIRTNLLAILNPEAIIYTVDNNDKSGYADAATGFMAAHNENVIIILSDTSDFKLENVDMCFIDADHTEEGVWKDSHIAWEAKNVKENWCIVWDDYSLKGVKAGVDRFIGKVKCKLSTVGGLYIIGTKIL